MKENNNGRPGRRRTTPEVVLHIEGEPDDTWYKGMGQILFDLLGPGEGIIDEVKETRPTEPTGLKNLF